MSERRRFSEIRLIRDVRDGLLKSECQVARAFRPSEGQREHPHRTFTAMWDTGSNVSSISETVIKHWSLKPEAVKRRIIHAGGVTENRSQYYVSLRLPNKAHFPYHVVTEVYSVGFDVLIGMDIISEGDLLVLAGAIHTDAIFRYPTRDDGGSGMIQTKPKSVRKRRPRGRTRRQ